MEKCLTIEQGVARVLKIFEKEPAGWELIPAGEGDYTDTLVLEGEKYPLFWWRSDPQVDMMHDLAPERKICSMKLNRTCPKSWGLNKLLYKELDIAEYMIGSPVKTVMNFRQGSSMNMLCTMENDRVAIFELGATLHDGTDEQGRHTYWGEAAMASDRVVSQKLPSRATYLFTQDSPQVQTYHDLFIYMFGLSATDVIKAVCISEILLGRRDISDWKEKDAHYRCCIAMAEESAQQVRCLPVYEEVQ